MTSNSMQLTNMNNHAPTDISPHTSTIVLGGSPAPERVIELIMASTANLAAEAAASGTIPMSLAPTILDMNSPTTIHRQSSHESLETQKRLDQRQRQKSDDQDKSTSTSRQSTPPTPGTKIRQSSSRPQRPKYQVAFEFKENPGVKWLFPQESSLECAPSDGGEPVRISASFYLPTEEPYIGGNGVTNKSSNYYGQATTVVILHATDELWEGLQQSVSDPAATYRSMTDKMKHIPPRTYVQYNVSPSSIDEQVNFVDHEKSPETQDYPIGIDTSKRAQEPSIDEQLTAKVKRPKTTQDDKSTSGQRVSTLTKKNSGLSTPQITSTHPRQCAYCGCTSTPTWRRGPDGPHTLCNACGVKWRQGRIFIDTPPLVTPVVEVPTPPLAGIPTTASPISIPGPDIRTTTADAAARMCHGLVKLGDTQISDTKLELQQLGTSGESRTSIRHEHGVIRKQYSFTHADEADDSEGDLSQLKHGDKASSNKRKNAKTSGPVLVPIHQIEETSKEPGKVNNNLKKVKDKTKTKEKDKSRDKSKISETDRDETSNMSESTDALQISSASNSELSSDITTSPMLITNQAPALSNPTETNSLSACPSLEKAIPVQISLSKQSVAKAATTTQRSQLKLKTPITSAGATLSTKPLTTTLTAVAKPSIMKITPNAARYHAGQVAGTSSGISVDDGLSLYATKNLYTNNTATFPLHFPTISIAFGPNNAYYMYPNCAVVLFENHFQIKLIHSGERTDIDVWKEGIEKTEFQVVDVGDGESMIVMKFQKDLLNPEKNETLIVFRFRERLDGGGPPVKPLLEQWLTTEIPVAGS
ncbi:hypothetical protein BGZ76_007539 [Entomortierella beljakovae]|nr:hypothetical protein BGZ76_007539 [Entomortierella beljakovae]